MFLKNGLDMDDPRTWPAPYQKAHAYGSVPTRWCCVDRMANNPPTEPGQFCRDGHPLSWYDPEDPERGWFEHDELKEACIYCNDGQQTVRDQPYCCPQCGISAQNDSDNDWRERDRR